MASVWIEEAHGGYVIKWRENGERRTSRTYARKSEAEVAAVDLRQKLGPTVRRRRAGRRPVEHLTIDAIAEQWAAAHADETPGHDDYLVEVQANVKRLAKAMHWVSPGDANVDAIRSHLASRGGRGRRQLSYLRAVLRWAARKLDQPLDEKVDQELAAPPSKEADMDLLTEDQVDAIRERANELEVGALVDCLLTYGWRPATACRILVGDVDLDRGRIKIGTKHNGTPWRHPLFPVHVEQLRALAADRSKEDALFLNPQGEPWRLRRGEGGAEQLAGFFRDNIRPQGAEGNIYRLKNWAISKMDEGAHPWRRKLSTAQIALYTGHRTKTQILRYLRTNEEEARDLMAVDDRGGNSPGHEGADTALTGPEATEGISDKVLKFPGRTA